MQRVLDDARRAVDIIARIRAMAAGRTPQQIALAHHDVITESMLFLRHELQSKGVSVSLDLAPALPQVTGDRTQFHRVVVNLAINAVVCTKNSIRVFWRRNRLCWLNDRTAAFRSGHFGFAVQVEGPACSDGSPENHYPKLVG